jgi:hypothetical protein
MQLNTYQIIWNFEMLTEKLTLEKKMKQIVYLIIKL